MNILFYTCFNERSITLESTIMYFKEKGDTVFFLTTCPQGKFHKHLELKGIKCYSTNSSNNKKSNWQQILLLIQFCKKNKIDILHSHLQLPNLYAAIANYFIKTKVLTVRHNSDIIYSYGSKKEVWIEKVINRLSPCIIAISNKVLKQLTEVEKVSEKKIVRINNGYNFELYNSLSSLKEFNTLSETFKNKFIILSSGRLMLSKRHNLCIEAMPELIKKNSNIHLIIVGEGPEKKKLENLIIKLNLTNNVSLFSYKENIVDYIKLATVAVQLSISEASNNTIKEAAFFNKICIACNDVGDFPDYMLHQKNSFLLQKENPLLEYIHYINLINDNLIDFQPMGKALKEIVIQNFDIRKIGKDYDKLHLKKLNNLYSS